MRKSGHSISSEEISGVWYRRPVLPVLEIVDAPSDVSRQLALEARVQYESVLRTLNQSVWVSLPERLRVAEDRVAQLRAAQSCGFRVPDTIIANSPDCVREFLSRHGYACMKPILLGQMLMQDGLKIYYTSLVSAEDSEVLSRISNFPVLMQEYIPKLRELRITVVGNRVFPVEIDCHGDIDATIDWRIDNGQRAEFRPTYLPDATIDMALSMTKCFGVQFASMDVVVAHDEHFYFLDLNPNGQWAWLDQQLDLGIATELSRVLTGRQQHA